MSLAAWLHYITGANLLVYNRIYHCCYRTPNCSKYDPKLFRKGYISTIQETQLFKALKPNCLENDI
jgi:hypothetical protein